MPTKISLHRTVSVIYRAHVMEFPIRPDPVHPIMERKTLYLALYMYIMTGERG